MHTILTPLEFHSGKIAYIEVLAILKIGGISKFGAILEFKLLGPLNPGQNKSLATSDILSLGPQLGLNKSRAFFKVIIESTPSCMIFKIFNNSKLDDI